MAWRPHLHQHPIPLKLAEEKNGWVGGGIRRTRDVLDNCLVGIESLLKLRRELGQVLLFLLELPFKLRLFHLLLFEFLVRPFLSPLVPHCSVSAARTLRGRLDVSVSTRTSFILQCSQEAGCEVSPLPELLSDNANLLHRVADHSLAGLEMSLELSVPGSRLVWVEIFCDLVNLVRRISISFYLNRWKRPPELTVPSRRPISFAQRWTVFMRSAVSLSTFEPTARQCLALA